jgi:hypothetical protein
VDLGEHAVESVDQPPISSFSRHLQPGRRRGIARHVGSHR